MKRNLLFLLLLFSTCLSFAQTGEEDYYTHDKKEEQIEKKDSIVKKPKSFLDRCYTGGNFSLSLGNLGSYIEVSPILGYNFTDYFSFGVSLTYRYFSGLYSVTGLNYRTHIYGGSIFSRLLLGRRLIIQGELEALNTEVYNPTTRNFGRKFVPLGLFGGGVRNDWGGGSYSYFLIMYDFINDPNSPNPFSPFAIKIGFAIPLR